MATATLKRIKKAKGCKPEIKTMPLAEVRAILRGSEGKIFKVTFIKRTTGEVRTMYARIGVSKDIKGTGLGFDPYSKGLMTVFDMSKNEYRMINLEGVISLKMMGQEYLINEYKKEAV